MTKMITLFTRQGVPIDTDEYEKAKQSRRNKNIAAAHEVLTRNHIDYQPLDNTWFKIEDQDHSIDYNPSTGQWIDCKICPVHKDYGIRNLVRYLRGIVN